MQTIGYSGPMLAQPAQIPGIRDIAQILWSNRKQIFLIALIPFLLGIVYIFVVPNKYQSIAIVMLEQQNLNLANFQDTLAGMKFDDMTVQTEAKLIASPALASKTIKAAKLESTDEFNPNDAPAGAKGTVNYEVLKNFRKNLGITPQGGSRVIEISFKSKDPELAANVANMHANLYLAAAVDSKRERAQKLSGWMEEQIADLRKKAVEKSQAVQRYRADNGLALGKDSQELIYQQISDVASQLVNLEVRKMDQQSRLNAISDARSQGRAGAVTEVVSSPAIQDLKVQRSLSAQKMNAMNSDYGPNHPKRQAAMQELRGVQGAIGSETANIETAVMNEAKTAERQEGMLNNKLAALRKQADQSREKLISLKELELEETAAQKLLDNFLARYEEVKSQIDLARSDAHLVAEATVSGEPVEPNKPLLLAIITILSGVFAVSVIFAREMMSSGLRNFDHIRSINQTPLGIMPLCGNTKAAIASPHNTTYKEAIKRIYMNGLMQKEARAILVTSALPDEGKSTLVMSLGSYLVSIGHKTVVIDADFLSASLAKDSKVKSRPGLTDYLSHNASINDIIQVNAEGLAVVPAGTEDLYSPDVLASKDFDILLAQLRHKYEYIFIDSGPMLARSDAAVISGLVDGTVVVAEWMKTSAEDLKQVIETIQHFSGKITGIVMNKVDLRKYKSINSGSDFLLPRYA